MVAVHLGRSLWTPLLLVNLITVSVSLPLPDPAPQQAPSGVLPAVAAIPTGTLSSILPLTTPLTLTSLSTFNVPDITNSLSNFTSVLNQFTPDKVVAGLVQATTNILKTIIPNFSLPNLGLGLPSLPGLPNLGLPGLGLPNLGLPTTSGLGLPSISLPSVAAALPVVNLPTAPAIALPSIALPSSSSSTLGILPSLSIPNLVGGGGKVSTTGGS